MEFDELEFGDILSIFIRGVVMDFGDDHGADFGRGVVESEGWCCLCDQEFL